jgi:hypothetical protein
MAEGVGVLAGQDGGPGGHAVLDGVHFRTVPPTRCPGPGAPGGVFAIDLGSLGGGHRGPSSGDGGLHRLAAVRSLERVRFGRGGFLGCSRWSAHPPLYLNSHRIRAASCAKVPLCRKIVQGHCGRWVCGGAPFRAARCPLRCGRPLGNRLRPTIGNATRSGTIGAGAADRADGRGTESADTGPIRTVGTGRRRPGGGGWSTNLGPWLGGRAKSGEIRDRGGIPMWINIRGSALPLV